MPQKISREDAIKRFGLHYQPGLDGIDIRLDQPRSLADRLSALTDRKVSNTITLVENLGPASEDFHFRTVGEAAVHMAAEQRAALQRRRDAIKALLQDDEAAALQASPASRNLSAIFENAAQTLKDIDQALTQNVTIKVRPLKDEISLPSRLLDVGDTVYVLRETNALPVLTTESVAARNLDGFVPFGNKYDVSVSYVFGKPAAGAPEKNNDTYVYAIEDDSNRPAGAIAVAANTVAFSRAADAKAALRDIISNKIEQLDAERQSLVNTLRQEGLSPRRKPRSPKN
ncbi:MAG: hypothetical protein ACK4PK_04855 [Alphaproteobacteria bacterium]